MHRKKIWLVSALIILLVAVYGYFTHKSSKEERAHGFNLAAITLADNNTINTAAMPPEIYSLLQQPFFYLGKGRQYFAFQSADEKYVLKFIQQQRFKGPDKEEKLHRLVDSTRIAAELLPHETAVLYTHLQRTKAICPITTIMDRHGDIIRVSLDTTQFIVQQKAAPLKQSIVKLMESNQKEQAEQCIASLFDLILVCAQKNVQDTDGALIRNNNIGLINNCAIYIDIGKLEQVPMNKVRLHNNLRRLHPLLNWLKKEYPDLVPAFTQSLTSTIDTFDSSQSCSK